MKENSSTLPDGFVYLEDEIPNIRIYLRYLTEQNFVGHIIPGYKANKGIMTKEAAAALKIAAEKFSNDGYDIVVYDAYRPQQAVTHFVDWIKNSPEEKRKKFHFPRVDKTKLIDLGYVASKSGHSKGSTIDLSIIKKENQLLEEAKTTMRKFKDDTIELPFNDDGTVDCGTSFDLMDEASHGDSQIVTEEQKKMRDYILSVMEESGFKKLEEEWWHYTLKDEPYPDTYFSFPVE